MSSIIFKRALVPQASSPQVKCFAEYEPPLVLENVLEFSEEEYKGLTNPDPKAARSMSKAALLMTDVGMSTQSIIAQTLEQNPFKVAMYAVIDNGPDDYKSVFSTADLEDAAYPQTYKKSRSPKQYLKQLPNIAPAQLGIFLGVMGATNVFVNTKHGILHALEQAEVDLASGVADSAMVISAMSLEDALLDRRYQLSHPQVPLSEGAAVLILKKDGTMTNWREKIEKIKNQTSYGIATNLINLIQEKIV